MFTNKKKVNNNLISIKIDSGKIIRVSETKFLGLIIDEHLTWKPQIKHNHVFHQKFQEIYELLIK